MLLHVIIKLAQVDYDLIEVTINYTTVLFQVEDKIALVLRSDQRKLNTPALVSETLIRLAADDLMSQSLSQNVSQSNIEFAQLYLLLDK